jgi:hypothetical protein
MQYFGLAGLEERSMRGPGATRSAAHALALTFKFRAFGAVLRFVTFEAKPNG